MPLRGPGGHRRPMQFNRSSGAVVGFSFRTLQMRLAQGQPVRLWIQGALRWISTVPLKVSLAPPSVVMAKVNLVVVQMCSFFAVPWVLAGDPDAQGESLRAAPSGTECVLLTCVRVAFPRAGKREILQTVLRWSVCISWAWISTMLVSVGKYCVVNGWKFNVCCEFIGLKHWKFFIRQCLHTSPEEPLRVYIWNFKIY